MTTYYVDPDAVGADDGSSWAAAWTTWQRAIDGTGGVQPGPGDKTLMRGEETLSADNVLDGLTGTAANWVKWIGVNASGVVDGTRYSVDASGGSHNGAVGVAGSDYMWLENIDVLGGSAHAIQFPSGSEFHVLINCIAHGATGTKRGFSIVGSGILFRCAAYANSEIGIYASSDYSKIIACRSSGNSSHGLSLNGAGCVAFGCASYENTGQGYYLSSKAHAWHCFGDANADAFEIINTGSLLHNCRATNGTNGVIVAASNRALISLLYTGGNSGTELDADFEELLWDAVNSKITTEGSDTDHGYVDSASDDYNLDPDEATYYSEALELI